MLFSECYVGSDLSCGASREQERIAKAEAARRETERILREQQAEVDAKKADMVKRDIQREKVSGHHVVLCWVLNNQACFSVRDHASHVPTASSGLMLLKAHAVRGSCCSRSTLSEFAG